MASTSPRRAATSAPAPLPILAVRLRRSTRNHAPATKLTRFGRPVTRQISSPRCECSAVKQFPRDAFGPRLRNYCFPCFPTKLRRDSYPPAVSWPPCAVAVKPWFLEGGDCLFHDCGAWCEPSPRLSMPTTRCKATPLAALAMSRRLRKTPPNPANCAISIDPPSDEVNSWIRTAA